MNTFYKIKVYINPKDMFGDIDKVIQNHTEKLLLNKEIKNIGYIKSIKIIKIEDVCIDYITGNSIYYVYTVLDIFYPKVDEIYTFKIKNISNHGIFLDTFLDTFVTSENIKDKKIGDSITFIVKKVNYLNKKHIIIGKEL